MLKMLIICQCFDENEFPYGTADRLGRLGLQKQFSRFYHRQISKTAYLSHQYDAFSFNKNITLFISPLYEQLWTRDFHRSTQNQKIKATAKNARAQKKMQKRKNLIPFRKSGRSPPPLRWAGGRARAKQKTKIKGSIEMSKILKVTFFSILGKVSQLLIPYKMRLQKTSQRSIQLRTDHFYNFLLKMTFLSQAKSFIIFHVF